jgi:hypothetical protein
MSKYEKALEQVRVLDEELKAHTIAFRKYKTYQAAAALQKCGRDRMALIKLLRSRIKVAVDNSAVMDELG